MPKKYCGVRANPESPSACGSWYVCLCSMDNLKQKRAGMGCTNKQRSRSAPHVAISSSCACHPRKAHEIKLLQQNLDAGKPGNALTPNAVKFTTDCWRRVTPGQRRFCWAFAGVGTGNCRIANLSMAPNRS